MFERGQRGLGQRQGRPADLGGGVADEPRSQEPNVSRPLAQRRQPQDEPLQPEIEILAEPALGAAALEVPVARGDHPDVDGGRTRRTDPVEGLVLEHAQELALMLGA